MNDIQMQEDKPQEGRPQDDRSKDKLIVATAALCGCFGCHMSLLDIDERILQLVELVEFDRTPLTDIKTVGKCDIGLIEGGVANVHPGLAGAR